MNHNRILKGVVFIIAVFLLSVQLSCGAWRILLTKDQMDSIPTDRIERLKLLQYCADKTITLVSPEGTEERLIIARERHLVRTEYKTGESIKIRDKTLGVMVGPIDNNVLRISFETVGDEEPYIKFTNSGNGFYTLSNGEKISYRGKSYNVKIDYNEKDEEPVAYLCIYARDKREFDLIQKFLSGRKLPPLSEDAILK
jgi:hypothetical protein